MNNWEQHKSKLPTKDINCRYICSNDQELIQKITGDGYIPTKLDVPSLESTLPSVPMEQPCLPPKPNEEIRDFDVEATKIKRQIIEVIPNLTETIGNKDPYQLLSWLSTQPAFSGDYNFLAGLLPNSLTEKNVDTGGTTSVETMMEYHHRCQEEATKVYCERYGALLPICKIDGKKPCTEIIETDYYYSYSTISRCQLTRSSSVAVKRFRVPILNPLKYKDIIYMQTREIKIHSRLQHPNIVQLIGVLDSGNRTLLGLDNRTLIGFVMELCECDLISYFKNNKQATNTQLFQILLDIVRALSFIHKCNLIHNDIKPENVLMTSEGKAKLTDFGYAQSKTETFKMVGTLRFVPHSKLTTKTTTQSDDIYSYAILMWYLLESRGEKYPFEDLCDKALVIMIKDGEPTSKLQLTEQKTEPMKSVYSLIRRNWAMRREDRPTADDNVPILTHAVVESRTVAAAAV